MSELKIGIGFGRRNQHCMNCGDERGGPIGHETQECLYASGMTTAELAETMPPEKRSKYWNAVLDWYFENELKGTTPTE